MMRLRAGSFGLSGQLAHEVFRCACGDAASVPSLQGFRGEAIIAPRLGFAQEERRVSPVLLTSDVCFVTLHLGKSPLDLDLETRTQLRRPFLARTSETGAFSKFVFRGFANSALKDGACAKDLRVGNCMRTHHHASFACDEPMQ